MAKMKKMMNKTVRPQGMMQKKTASGSKMKKKLTPHLSPSGKAKRWT